MASFLIFWKASKPKASLNGLLLHLPLPQYPALPHHTPPYNKLTLTSNINKVALPCLAIIYNGYGLWSSHLLNWISSCIRTQPCSSERTLGEERTPAPVHFLAVGCLDNAWKQEFKEFSILHSTKNEANNRASSTNIDTAEAKSADKKFESLIVWFFSASKH